MIDIRAAQARIAPYIRRTPVLDLSEAGFGPLFLKLDTQQFSGSFKIRGAANTILSQPTPPRRVCAASGGNHGAGVALMAQRLGISADIFVPRTAPKAKIDRLNAYGATIHLKGVVFADAFESAQKFAAENEALFIHAYNDEAVIAGQASCTLEFQEQAEFDTLFVSVGGGGLSSGCALAMIPGTKLVCVETDGTAALSKALKNGGPVEVNVSGLAADALGAKRLGDLPYKILSEAGVTSLLVSDDDVRAAQRWLWDTTRLIAEPGGATALAALTSGVYTPAKDERIGVIVCGANCDPASIAQ